MTEKLNDFASRLPKGTPKGLGLGVGLLAGTTAAIYGIYRSMFTGNIIIKINYRLYGTQNCLSYS